MRTIEIASQGLIESASVSLARFCNEDSQCKAGSVDAYLGIPFAQPPIGSLRWRRPQRPAPAWQGTRKSEWQRDCPQELMLTEYVTRPRRDLDRDESGKTTLSEDCLYLNVWVPASGKAGDKLPVLVWVFGGGCICGSTSEPKYDGARLAHEANCIVVSITYRVGLFGWLGSKELAGRTEGEGTGNFGAWDVIASLEWLQAHIESFGGDAGNITLWGESAGALVVHLLLLSPETPPNLFCRAVLNSGVVLTKAPRTMQAAQATFDAILIKLGGSSFMSEQEKLDIMCKASTADLFKASSSLPAKRPRTEWRVDETKGRPAVRLNHDPSTVQIEAQSVYGPVWDGVTVPHDFLNLAMKGLPAHMSNGQKGIMIGHCADEGSFFNLAVQTPIALQRHISGYHPHLIDEIKQLYAVDAAQSKQEVFAVVAAVTGDEILLAPVRDLTLRLANQTEVPAYAFLFAHRPSKQCLRGHASSEGGVQLQTTAGATHSAELPFFFGNDGAAPHIFEREDYPGSAPISRDVGFTVEEQHMSLYLMRSLDNFTRQKPPWIPLNSGKPVSEVEDCQVLTIGQFASLGSNTPAANNAAAREGQSIPINEQRLGDHIAWSQRVGLCASQKERHNFWASDNFRRLLLANYGDSRITFMP